MANPAMLALPLLPYKLLHAHALAEHGHLAQALQYLGTLRAGLGALGAKMPAALLVCSGMAADLEQRLRAHAAVGPLLLPVLPIDIVCVTLKRGPSLELLQQATSVEAHIPMTAVEVCSP